MSIISSIVTHSLKTKVPILTATRLSSAANQSEISLARPKKEKYLLQYKVCLVNPDGSSYHIRHNAPLGCIRLPIDPNSLTEEELKARMKKKRSEKKVQVKIYAEEKDVEFDSGALRRLLMKK